MMKKRILSFLLAIVMVCTLLPMTVFASDSGYVYLSISFDGEYINDTTGSPIVYVPVSLDDIAAVDLTAYGLENMLFDANGDGNYETTALQLMIYAHEELYGGDWSDVNFSAIPGSSYFAGGIFGFTENLMYFHNGDFPVDESQQASYTVGATSDRIVLKDGDFLDVASFSCYAFYGDPDGGFHFFGDENGDFAFNLNANVNEPLSFQLIHSFCDLMMGEAYTYGAADYEVYYGTSYGEAIDTLYTDGDGLAEITFDAPGTYYLWCYGANSADEWGMHGSCDYTMENGVACIVSAPAYAKVTVKSAEPTPTPTPTPAPEVPREAQDVSAVLNATMAQLAATVTAPAFGTSAGEWTVFSLARGNYFAKDNAYFTDYYGRIVETVNEIAAKVNLNGGLDKNKSTENSRLIMTLSAIGKDATAVGDWNLVEAYSANGINWIKKQGINGTIWTLIALDSHNYETSDATIRQQCVDSILSLQHTDGGWSLTFDPSTTSNVDITGMALTALSPYRDQPAVAEACEEAIAWLSEAQLSSGGFPYGTNGETSESCAWAIVALTTWGINPDTDSRFIKDGNSAVDNLLSYYVEADRMFAHQGTESNAMATDQACYALVAYDRFVKGQPALYDYSDVTFDVPTVPDAPIVPDEPEAPAEMTATLGLPAEITPNSTFKGTLSINTWDNNAGYKLIDLVAVIPEGIEVTSVTANDRLAGGSINYNVDNGSLRVVYFDANNHSDLTVSGEQFPADLFTIECKSAAAAGTKCEIAVDGMSVKLTSDSSEDASMVVVNTEAAKGTVNVVEGISYSAVCLYEGDGVDLIPTDKKAVAISVTKVDGSQKLTYNDGTNSYEFKHSPEISSKTGVATYIALVDASIEMASFVNHSYIKLEGDASTITFGDSNNDAVINAQDALAAVDTWLRKTDAPTDDQILTMNVNGDSRINTFDALGIVEAFVDGSEYLIITLAANAFTKN